MDLQYALKTFTGKALLTGSSSTHHSDSHRGCISDVDNGENHYGDIQLHLVYCPWHLQCFPLTSNDKWFYAETCHTDTRVLSHTHKLFHVPYQRWTALDMGDDTYMLRHYDTQRSYWVK